MSRSLIDDFLVLASRRGEKIVSKPVRNVFSEWDNDFLVTLSLALLVRCLCVFSRETPAHTLPRTPVNFFPRNLYFASNNSHSILGPNQVAW